MLFPIRTDNSFEPHDTHTHIHVAKAFIDSKKKRHTRSVRKKYLIQEMEKSKVKTMKCSAIFDHRDIGPLGVDPSACVRLNCTKFEKPFVHWIVNSTSGQFSVVCHSIMLSIKCCSISVSSKQIKASFKYDNHLTVIQHVTITTRFAMLSFIKSTSSIELMFEDAHFHNKMHVDYITDITVVLFWKKDDKKKNGTHEKRKAKITGAHTFNHVYCTVLSSVIFKRRVVGVWYVW